MGGCGRPAGSWGGPGEGGASDREYTCTSDPYSSCVCVCVGGGGLLLGSGAGVSPKNRLCQGNASQQCTDAFIVCSPSLLALSRFVLLPCPACRAEGRRDRGGERLWGGVQGFHPCWCGRGSSAIILTKYGRQQSWHHILGLRTDARSAADMCASMLHPQPGSSKQLWHWNGEGGLIRCVETEEVNICGVKCRVSTHTLMQQLWGFVDCCMFVWVCVHVSLRLHVRAACKCHMRVCYVLGRRDVSTEGQHAYTCMLTSIHPTRIVKR